MNIDFLLFNGPSNKVNFVDLWGQVIFIPSFNSLVQKQKSFFEPLINCYNSTKTIDSYFTIQKKAQQIQKMSKIQQFINNTNSNNSTTVTMQQQQQQPNYYIPCLYLDSLVNSKYLIIYFHSSGQDIKLAQNFLKFLRNLYQVNIIAIQYPNYSIYKGNVNSKQVNHDAKIVYQYIVNKLKFKQQNIIILGRSIGTGVSLQLFNNQTSQNLNKTKQLKQNNQIIIKPRAVVLISPFCSIKSLVRNLGGKIAQMIVKQQCFNNLSNIKKVIQKNISVFILHGKKDKLISYQHSQNLYNQISKYQSKAKIKLQLSQQMTHGTFDYYIDLADPLRQFLIQIGVNFYQQNMNGPKIPQELYKNPIIIKDFILINKLGQGKFGQVHSCLHKLTNSLYAIKILKKQNIIINNSIQQVVKQIKIQYSLNHPNIIKLYSIFNDKFNIYLLMQLCNQGNLYSQLKIKIKFQQKKISYYMKQLCDAIKYIHNKKIIHRDIKAQNIVFSYDILKICDFGWSTQTSNLRQTFCGSPLYMSPQLLVGKMYDQKVDIWALGVLCYQLLTGRIPFSIKKQSDLLNIIDKQIYYPQYIDNQIISFLKNMLQKDYLKRATINQLVLHSFIK